MVHPIDPSRLEIAVVGHTRHTDLQAALHLWPLTIPGYRQITLIANHPTTTQGLVLPDRTHVVPTGRIPNHVGQLSESWNLAFLWTFVQHPETEWVILSQDDVRVAPGWVELVNAHPAEVYNAPAGDMIMLISRRAFQLVGWFDEHIRSIGGQDLDWLCRAVITLGADRIVSEDHHGWSYNPIGLTRFWESSKGGGTPGASYQMGGYLDVVLKAHLHAKWGISTQELHERLIAHQVPMPVQPEYDWYPWVTR